MDWGTLAALKTTRNWGAIQQGYRDQLVYQQGINQMQDAEIGRQQQAQKEMADYFKTVNSLGLDAVGMKKVREVEPELRNHIAEGIKEFGGDLDKYMQVRGMADLESYLNNLYYHPVTQRELYNAMAIKRAQADREAGLQERYQFDANGNPTNTFDEQQRAREDGKLDVLKYGGGFKPGKFDEKFFGQTYGSTNRYQPKAVSTEDYAATAARHLMDQGMSPQDAKQQALGMAHNYAQHLSSKGTPLQWKSDKYTANEALAAFKLAKLKRMGGTEGGISYLAGIHDNLIAPDWASPDMKKRYYKPATPDLHSMVQAAGHEINPKTGGVKSIASMAARGGIYSMDFKPLDLNGINDKDMTAVPVAVVHKDGKDYLQYRVKATDDALKAMKEGGKPVEGNIFQSNQPVAGASVTRTGHWFNPFAGHQMEFDMLEEIPFNPSTIAQQGLTAHEFSKTGQLAEGTGNYYSKMQQMSTDLLQEDEELPIATETNEPSE